jgi:molecular chaperone IbpA
MSGRLLVSMLLKEDVAMRTYDFTPLWRSSIGFDRVFDLLNSNFPLSEQSDYPPYNIERLGEDQYRITLAVAGFAPGEVSISIQPNQLVVTGEKPEKDSGEFLHRGIAGRPFEQRFSLEDHVEVEGASFENGLLRIDLVRRIPEAMKPRQIAISQTGAAKLAKAKTVEHPRAA